ncbi:hypothetical protein HQ865_01190 [Mucilaginibacter mali]|uniref:Uncharacterized protein n=1 Tax=Mucilaginibacter mali TaxID=2740462 RepID=A0A7D4QPA0_9SPHI|nr:hypothetical protein [Mucilaginibacter mali]QKJ28429.1 hypothetical protein HQ865_01190 [Mucilaginibacter mali]
MGKIILAAIAGYIAWAIYLSNKNKMLTLPLVKQPDVEPLTPGQFADAMYQYLVKEKGFKVMLHPTHIAIRDRLFSHILAADDNQVKQMAASWNSKYAASGSLVKVVRDTPADPFDKDHTKTSVILRLNGLNIK